MAGVRCCPAARLPPLALALARAEPGRARRGALRRREHLLAAPLLLAARSAGAAEEAAPAVVSVASGQELEAALASAPAGAVLELEGGEYRARLVLSRSVTVRAAAGASSVIEWVTKEPYQSVVDVGVRGCVLEGLTLRHSSKSVAQNYAIFVREGAQLTMRRCAVSSATGSGLGVEGGEALLEGCDLSGSKAHGAALYGDLLGGAAPVALRNCRVERNGGCGVLARQGARPQLEGVTIRGNGDAAVAAVDARVSLRDCRAEGALRLELGGRYEDGGGNMLSG